MTLTLENISKDKQGFTERKIDRRDGY